MILDYYDLLGVDARADRAEIENALNRRQPEWSMMTRQSGEGARYLGYLEQIPALRAALLTTHEARAAYDASLEALRQRASQTAVPEMLRLVRLRAAKGGLTVSDRQLLRQESERFGLRRSDLDRLLEPFPPLPEPPGEWNDEVSVEPIEPMVARQIRSVLESLGRRDLYDLLELPRDVADPEIGYRVAEVRRQVSKRGPATEEAALWLNAIGLVQAHLGTPEARARYDQSLALEAHERFTNLATKTLSGYSGLDEQTREALLVEALSLGVAPEQAERLLRRVCRASGVALGVAGDGGATPLRAARRWLRCRACGGLTEFGWAEIHTSGLCRHCHVPLRWDCPVCKRSAWVDEVRCHCGFQLENLEPLIRHFEAAQSAFRLHHVGEALAHLRLVQSYAPQHIGARRGLEKLQDRINSIRKLRAEFERERAARRLVSARAVLDRWERLVAPSDARWKSALSEVSTQLAKAEGLTARAHELAENDAFAARETYRKALAIAHDLPEAIDGLQHCPPDGPTELFVEPSGGRVKLRWTAPEPDGLGAVGFRILRKQAAAPMHTNDGVVIANVEGCEWEDDRVAPGQSFGYAVCSVRNDVVSLFGVSAGPFLVTDEVRGVRVQPGPASVELTWVPPVTVSSILVVRKLGTPIEGPRDGVVVECGRDFALDKGLEDGRVVHYAVYALYRDQTSRTQASRGVFVSAVPGQTAQPVDDLSLEPELDGRLWLRWTPPTHGHVRILRSEIPLPWLRGEHRRAGELEGLEGTWLEPVNAGTSVEPLEGGFALSYYTPLTIASGVATVGRPETWARLADPNTLRLARSRRKQDLVTLRWRWGDGPQAAGALVSARRGRYPTGPDDPQATHFFVEFEKYWRDGRFECALPEQAGECWYVVVFTCVNQSGERWCSPGIEPSARGVVPSSNARMILFYELQRPKSGWGLWRIRFSTDPLGAAFGPTLLVARPRVLPLTAHDGSVVARFDESCDGDTRTFRPESRLTGRKLRLFSDASRSAAHGVEIDLCIAFTHR